VGKKTDTLQTCIRRLMFFGVCVCVCVTVCVCEFQTVHVTIQEGAHGLFSKRVITVCSRKCVVWLEIIKSWKNFF
jgi:hypothetical protein